MALEGVLLWTVGERAAAPSRRRRMGRRRDRKEKSLRLDTIRTGGIPMGVPDLFKYRPIEHSFAPSLIVLGSKKNREHL